jgi:hypothetical protein
MTDNRRNPDGNASCIIYVPISRLIFLVLFSRLLFEKCFFATFFAGKGGEEGRTLSSQLGVRGFLFLSSEAVFFWLFGEIGAQD